jgi:diguanylate cyclase (GGDEF)-like protein
MQVAPEIRSRLVHILYSAMPQVASSTMGTVLLSGTVWWRIPSPWTAGLIAAAVVVAIIRLSVLFAYKRRNGDVPAPPAEAIFWERLYGAFSIIMAFMLGAVMLTAFRYGDSGVQLLTSGVAIGICGGQSTARVTCRPWIPLASGTIILSTLTVCALIWKDAFSPVFAIFAVLYLYTYIEACRHSARTILGRLIAESELAALVRRDSLTGLANRMGFEEELDRALLALRRNRGKVSLLMLDLDGFKAVNDDLGHLAGDAVLRGVADRLRGLSRRTDYLARLGGDEFAVVVSDPHDREGLSDYARRLIAGISEPFALSDRTVRIGVSIGIGTANALGPREAGELLAATDAALYRVKKGSKNDFAFAAARPDLVLSANAKPHAA